MAEERVATFVTARLGSSRFPRKALMPLRGRPLLGRVIEHVSRAREPDLVVLCTTVEPEDDELAALGEELGITVHRGPTDDILARWLGAAEANGVGFFAACDGDNVFCDPEYVDRVIERHRETGAEFVSCVGLPLGTAPLGVATEALARVCELKTETDTAGQARFFQNDLVSRAEVKAPEEMRMDDARLTLDYPEDAELVEAILEELEPRGEPVTLERVLTLLRSRPDLVAINSGRSEEYWRRFRELYPPVELGG